MKTFEVGHSNNSSLIHVIAEYIGLTYPKPGLYDDSGEFVGQAIIDQIILDFKQKFNCTIDKRAENLFVFQSKTDYDRLVKHIKFHKGFRK